MSSRYVSVRYSDLSYEAQQSLIDTIKESLLDKYKTAGEEAMLLDWHVAPKTWQEAFARENAVDYVMWNDLEETGEDFQKYDWRYAVDQYAEEQAELKLVTAFKYIEVEVEL